MPIPTNLFEPLRLSKRPLFQTGDPDQAARFAQDALAATQDPRILAELKRLGIPASVFARVVDVPTTAQGIRDFRETARGEREGLAGIGNFISEGAASMANFFGVDDPLLSVLGAGGADIPETAFAPLPDDPTVGLGPLGEVNPISLIPQLASFLVPAAAAVRGGAAVVGATTLAANSPKIAALLAFSLGGGGLEAGRQAVRTQTKGESFNPTAIAREAAIFGAGGFPFGGGALVRRGLAAGAAGTTAAATSLLPGEEFDPSRVLSETVFAAAFGNPKISQIVASGSPAPTLPGVAKGVAAKIKAEMPPRGKKAVSAQHVTIAQEMRNVANDVIPTTKKSDLPEPAIRDAEGVAERLEKAGQSPIDAAAALKARADIVEKLIKNSPEELLELIKTQGLSKTQQMVIRDAMATQKGRVTPAVDAPPSVTPMPPKDQRVLIHPKAEQVIGDLAKQKVTDKPFGAGRGDPQFMADAVATKGLTRKTDPIKPQDVRKIMKSLTPEERMTLAISMEDAKEAIKIERRQAGKLALDEVKLDQQAADRIKLNFDDEIGVVFEASTRTAETNSNALRQMLIDDFRLEGHRLKKQADVAKADGNEEAHQALEVKRQEVEAKAEAGEELEVLNFQQAKGIMDRLTDGMTLKQIRELKLPKELEPFKNLIEVEMRRKAKFRKETAKAKEEGQKVARDMDADPDVPVTIQVRGGAAAPAKGKAKTSKGVSFNDIRKAWHNQGGDLRPKDAGFEMTRQGQTFQFGSLKAARSALDDIDALVAHSAEEVKLPKVKKENLTKPVLEVAGDRKLVTVEHMGNGKYRTVDKTTGEAKTHSSLKTVADTISETPAPKSQELLPVPEELMTSGGGGSIGGPGESGRMPIFDMPEPRDVNFPTSFGTALGTQRNLMLKMQDSLKLPIFDEVWEPIMKAANLKDKFSSVANNELTQLFKGTQPGRRRVVMDLLISGKAKAQVIRDLKASKAEIASAEKLSKWYEAVMGLDKKQLNEFFTEVIPRFREEGGDPIRSRNPDNTYSGTIGEILDEVIDGRIDLSEPNAHALAQDILFGLARKRFMGPSMKAAREIQRQITKRQRIPEVEPAEVGQLKTADVVIQNFMDTMLTGIGAGGRGNATAQFMKPFFEQLKKMKLLKEVPGGKEVDQWASELASYISGAALSVRPALAMRNFLQRGLAANKVGWDTLLDAQRKALTAEGKALINDSGVIPGRVTWFVEDMAAMFKEEAEFRQFVLRAQSSGLYLYRKADHGNRGVSYLAGYLSVKKHAHNLKKGDVDTFLIETGIANESNTIISRILKPLQNVDAKSWDAALENSAKEYGMRLAEDTQFIYNPANAPAWTQNLVGKFAGQFGVWPIAFAEYGMRNLTGLGAGGARGAAAQRFLIRQLSQGLAISMAGAMIGIDASSYNKANPISYDGGPAFNAAGDMVTLTTGTEGEFGTRMAKRNLLRFFQTFWLPFGGLIQDFRQSLDQDSPYLAMLTALGFTTQEPGKILSSQ